MYSRDEENVEELDEADNGESERKAPHSSPVGQQHCHAVRLKKSSLIVISSFCRSLALCRFVLLLYFT